MLFQGSPVLERGALPASRMERADDEALARLAAQRADAFSELYRRHVQRVYRYLLSRVGDGDEAQQLTAETFMAALQAIARFQANSALTTWLLGIARHKAADPFRRRRQT